MPDAIFDDPRLARVYDPLDPDRSDLDVYAEIVDELGARAVLDIGCGTGPFACLLALRGIAVTAVDPAGASLDIARSKPGAERVWWLHGDAATLPRSVHVDAAFMTGNVAQVFRHRRRLAGHAEGYPSGVAAGRSPGLRDPRPGALCVG